MRIKKVLITGFTGMVGSHLADYILKNTNWHIFGMCNGESFRKYRNDRTKY